MGYTHYYRQKKNVPDEQWKTLCEKTSEVFNWLSSVENQSYYKNEAIVICDARGEKPLNHPDELFCFFNKSKAIWFNGEASKGLNHETFSLTQKKIEDFTFCKTARKPYDWFVVAVLILAHNVCPDCYDISSDGDEEWIPVLKWLNQKSGVKYLIPLSVISSAFQKQF